jgi:hypothetical protein
MITNNAHGAVSQMIILFGGIFFAVSGLSGTPANVISLRYVIPLCENTRDATQECISHANLADACPFYGITCFMVATTMGLWGVRKLPKALLGPFGAVACFFSGAWIIGVFGFWGPAIAGGTEDYNHLQQTNRTMLDMPSYTNTWVHTMQLIGSCFLTGGACVFGHLDNIFCCRGRSGHCEAHEECFA